MDLCCSRNNLCILTSMCLHETMIIGTFSMSSFVLLWSFFHSRFPALSLPTTDRVERRWVQCVQSMKMQMDGGAIRYPLLLFNFSGYCFEYIQYIYYIYIVLCFYLYNMSWFLWVFRPEHPIYCSSCKLTPQKAPLCNQRAYPQYRMYCIDFTFSHGGCNHSLAKGNRCRKLRMALPFVACEDMAFVNRKKGVSKPTEKDAVFIQGTRTRTVNSTKDHQENDQKFHSKNLWHYCSASQTMIASWPWNSKQYKNTWKQFLFCQILHVSDEKKPTWKRMIDGCRINGNAAIPIYIGWSMATGDGQAKWPLPSPAAQRRKRTHAARPGLVLCDVFNVACVVFFLVKLELGC